MLTRPQLGRELAATRPGSDANALGWTVQFLLPLVHPAPSGTWNTYGATLFADAEWTGVSGVAGDASAMVLRYLAAFGPASVSDARAWSGVGGLREVFEQLRPRLRVYLDEHGCELFDLPHAPIPDADEQAPVRFLPEFDAPLLAYDDRKRMMTDEVRRQVCAGSGVAATVLVDGTVAGMWNLSTVDETVTLTVRALRELSTADLSEVQAEALRLLTFTHPDAAHHDIHIHRAPPHRKPEPDTGHRAGSRLIRPSG